MDMIMTDLMPKGVDECIMIFDLGSFGLANMVTPRFLVGCVKICIVL